MSRYLFSLFADADFDDVAHYLGRLPARPATRIAVEIQRTLDLIGQYPYQGQAHSTYTRLLGHEVRSRLVASYRIYYRFDRKCPEILAILHASRDHSAILSARLA